MTADSGLASTVNEQIDASDHPLIQTRVVTANELIGWIRDGTPFSLARWGNGEWHSVFGRTRSRTSSGQDYVAELGEELRRVLRGRPPYMIELKRWEKVFGDAVDRWLIDEGLDSLDWIEPDILHKASMKSRMGPIIQALQNAPDFIAIGPGHLQAAQEVLGFSRLIEVPTKNAFSGLDTVRIEALEHARTLPDGAVVTLSAGMMAKILIDDLNREFGQRLILLDVGSLWDPYAGVLSRSYMRAEGFEPSR